MWFRCDPGRSTDSSDDPSQRVRKRATAPCAHRPLRFFPLPREPCITAGHIRPLRVGHWSSAQSTDEQGLREQRRGTTGRDGLRSRRTSDVEVMGSTGLRLLALPPVDSGGVRIRKDQSEPPILVDPLPSRVTCPTTALGWETETANHVPDAGA